MADGNLIETLKRIIRKQTTRIGSVVTNIHQGVASESPPLGAGAKQQWLWSRVPGGWLMTIQEFYASYTADGGYKTDIVDGAEGATVVATQTTQVHFLRGTVRTTVARAIDMAVSTNSARGEWAVYVDDTLQRKGVDSGRFTLTVDAGTHSIEIIAFSESLGVLVPRDLEVSATLESLRRPEWSSVSTGYVDAFMANPANILEWFTDPRCGGWRLMRRETETLGPITEISGVAPRGQIGVVISGDYQTYLELGEELTAGTETMGTVLGFTYDSVADETMVRMRLNPSVSAPSPNWIGRPVGSGKWNELSRVRRASVTGTIRHHDTSVRVGNIYEYKLQSFGLADETQVSPWSEIEYLRAGDVDPPGNIEFLPGYPAMVSARQVTAKFLTPEDEDYTGVRVYYRQVAFDGEVASATSGDIQPAGGGFTPGAYAGYTVLLPSGGTISGDIYQIVSDNTTTTFVTSGALLQVPQAGDRVVIFYDKSIVTDYGVPDQEDQLTFEPVFVGTRLGSGEYHFRTFDFTGNEQLFSGVTWNVTSDSPNPAFGTFLGESTLFQGSDPRFPAIPVGGCAWLPVTLDRNTAEVWVFAEQSVNTPVTISELSNNTQAWTLKRQEGDLPNVEDWSTMLYIATKTNYYQRVYAFGVGYAGQRGRTFTAEVRAVDTHSPTLPTVENLTATRGINSIDLSWTVPSDAASDYDIETLVLRNGYPLARLLHPAGTTYPYDQTLSDSGIASDVDYDYEVFLWSEGISGGLGVTNTPTEPAVAEIWNAIHLVIPIFELNQWIVYYREMPVGVGTVVLYYSFDGIVFNAGPTGDGSEPNDSGNGFFYGTIEHNDPSDVRRYYKLLILDGSNNQLGWSNTFLTSGTSSGSGGPISITTVEKPSAGTWRVVYDFASLDPTIAKVELRVSYDNLQSYQVVGSLTPISASTPSVTHVDGLTTDRHYRYNAYTSSGVFVGASSLYLATYP